MFFLVHLQDKTGFCLCYSVKFTYNFLSVYFFSHHLVLNQVMAQGF
jgi:hypothetical protein